ncbi:MAG: ATP-binding protein [Betaproteobacteria bacterium]|nr:ATP-binding protein [Betaproteobacteria bacterium]
MNLNPLHSTQTGLHHEAYALSDLLLARRFVQSLSEGVSRYPVHRELRFAARSPLEALFDRLALTGPWAALRIDAFNMILDSTGADAFFVTAGGNRKQSYCSVHFDIWAQDVGSAEAVKARLLDLAGTDRITEPTFIIDWHFMAGRGEVRNVVIEERADPPLLDAAYPEIPGGIPRFISQYLNSPDTILVLQGPPGTGKTRLIRAILAAMTANKGDQARALYTGDKKALEGDELFVSFITGLEDAFVVEDADHLLKPRCDGNEHLHRFLAIADGVVRSQGRKIIFSTNLPNVGDLDDAMIRPGRCFARVQARELTLAEAAELIRQLTPDAALQARAMASLSALARRSHSLADIYAAIREPDAEPQHRRGV